MLDIYVAGRTDNIPRVRMVQKVCRVAGHRITHDWTTQVEEVGGRADERHVTPELQRQFAQWDAKGVMTADLFIMVCSPRLCGTLIECGMALAYRKEIWILGQPERHSVFFHMDGVRQLSTLEQLNQEFLRLYAQPREAMCGTPGLLHRQADEA